MSPPLPYFAAAAAVIAAGLYGVWRQPNLVRKLLAVNVLGTGVFIVLLVQARRSDPPDPVPHALVLTGIVVAVSVTAFALYVIDRIRAQSGRARLPEERRPGDG